MNKVSTLSLLCFYFLIPTTNLLAQNIQRWDLGTEIGISYSNSSEDTAPLKKELLILPRIGITVNYSISKEFKIESGITYCQKGINSRGTTDPVYATVNLHQQLIQVPIIATYIVRLSNPKLKFGAGCGMYFSYGIGGRTKAKGIAFGQELDKDIRTFDTILQKEDLGLNFKIFSEYNCFVLNLGYELGLFNVGKSNVLGNNLDYKNRIMLATMGYRFNL